MRACLAAEIPLSLSFVTRSRLFSDEELTSLPDVTDVVNLD